MVGCWFILGARVLLPTSIGDCLSNPLLERQRLRFQSEGASKLCEGDNLANGCENESHDRSGLTLMLPTIVCLLDKDKIKETHQVSPVRPPTAFRTIPTP
jgi:hypothetical protein